MTLSEKTVIIIILRHGLFKVISRSNSTIGTFNLIFYLYSEFVFFTSEKVYFTIYTKELFIVLLICVYIEKFIFC